MPHSKLVNWLFETGAFRVSPEDKPFWYTSGTIGPYYINTHFLYGSEKKAKDLLDVIDGSKKNKLGLPEKLLPIVRENYAEDKVYKGLIDEMAVFIKTECGLDDIDYISGGERRDWFFSLITADILKKPHITIYKDRSAVISDDEGTRSITSLNTGRVLHMADLITEASSYERAWIPAIRSFGGKLTRSLVVVDRQQGGGKLLERNGIQSMSMVSIDTNFFKTAYDMGLITRGQYTMLLEYTGNPKESMKRFLKENPGFIEEALKSDEKTRERARLCIANKYYE